MKTKKILILSIALIVIAHLSAEDLTIPENNFSFQAIAGWNFTLNSFFNAPIMNSSEDLFGGPSIMIYAYWKIVDTIKLGIKVNGAQEI